MYMYTTVLPHVHVHVVHVHEHEQSFGRCSTTVHVHVRELLTPRTCICKQAVVEPGLSLRFFFKKDNLVRLFQATFENASVAQD